jgi:hypothetical protein
MPTNKFGAAQHGVHRRASGHRDIDGAGERRLGKPHPAGNIDGLDIEAIFLIELVFRNVPERHLTTVQLRIADADRRWCGRGIGRSKRDEERQHCKAPRASFDACFTGAQGTHALPSAEMNQSY